MISVTASFDGGNAVFHEISEEKVRFSCDIRDTTTDWFYWAFRVKDAAGKTIRFEMPSKRYVGPFGAAVSHDRVHWTWTHTASADMTGFTYAFGEDENDVTFAHDFLYQPARFDRFVSERGMECEIADRDLRGTPIRLLRLPAFAPASDGSVKTVVLTARHHCCEATGNYIMEGFLDEFLRLKPAGLSVAAIPFVDSDGVVRGDQGKNRAPHDHNRDYPEGLYPGVRAVQKLVREEKPEAVFDLHSPWHIGGRNNRVFTVRKVPESVAVCDVFSRCFKEEITPGSMRYDPADDIDPGVEWNVIGPHNTCASWAGDQPGVALAFTLETTYYGTADDMVSEEKLLETGRCFLRAYLRWRNVRQSV